MQTHYIGVTLQMWPRAYSPALEVTKQKRKTKTYKSKLHVTSILCPLPRYYVFCYSVTAP